MWADITALPAGVVGPAPDLCQLPGMPVNPLCLGRDLSSTLGGAASSMAGDAVREMARAVVQAARQVLAAVLAFLSAPIQPALHQGWFTDSFTRMVSVCATFAALFFILGVARAILRSSLSDLARLAAYTVGAFAGCAVALWLAQAFIAVVDVATGQVSAGIPQDIAATFAALMAPLDPMLGANVGQALLAAILAFFVGLGAVAVYLELFVRNVMIHVVVYFLPLVLIGGIWAPTRRWARRAIEFLAVLIFAKFVIFAVIALGWSAVASFGDQQLDAAWASVLTGLVLVSVAAYLPWLLFKLLPFMEAHVAAAMSRRDARAGLTAPVAGASSSLRTVESNLRRASFVSAALRGAPAAAGGAGSNSARTANGSSPGLPSSQGPRMELGGAAAMSRMPLPPNAKPFNQAPTNGRNPG